MTAVEKRRLRQKKYYRRHRERIKAKKLEEYYRNIDKNLANQKAYREKFIKPFTGKIGTGNYNITLAERHKEEWKKETLYLYLLEMEEESGVVFYKYGLTKNIKNRLYGIPYKVKVLQCLKMDKYNAIYKERELLNDINSYCPEKRFGGYKECFKK